MVASEGEWKKGPKLTYYAAATTRIRHGKLSCCRSNAIARKIVFLLYHATSSMRSHITVAFGYYALRSVSEQTQLGLNPGPKIFS